MILEQWARVLLANNGSPIETLWLTNTLCCELRSSPSTRSCCTVVMTVGLFVLTLSIGVLFSDIDEPASFDKGLTPEQGKSALYV